VAFRGVSLYGRENLGGVLGFFSLKNPSKLKKIPKKGRGFDPQNPSLNTPLVALSHLCTCRWDEDIFMYEKNMNMTRF